MARCYQISRSIVLDAQSFVHQRAGCCVLQACFPARVQALFGSEGSQRGLMKATQDQLFLARIMIDIADGVDPRRTRLKPFGIDVNSLTVYIEAPFCYRSEFGGEAVKDNYGIARNFALDLANIHRYRRDSDAVRFVSCDLADDGLHLTGFRKLAHAIDSGGAPRYSSRR